MRAAIGVLVCAFGFVAVCGGAVLPAEEYDPSVPTLKSVTGADPGGKILSYAEIERYIKALDEASDRVRVYSDGQTYNARRLYYMCVSDAANLARLDDIASAARRVREGKGELPADHPVTVAIYAAVHGDEISSVEAALCLAYYFAASGDEEVRDLLKNEVVVIDPLQNPDGRERFLAHYEWMRAGEKPLADQNAAEHSEFWPGGRGNGNFFDMNRDWFSLTQPESMARVNRYFARLPQVLVDLHEMSGNSTYFFPPPTDPLNQHVQPEIIKLFDLFGRANATTFDKKGFTYYTGETFDEFFPGYGSSWPLYLGSVGMTYEQASAGGLLFRKDTGEVLTYEDTVSRHFTSSLTTCLTAFRNRADILRSYSTVCQRAWRQIPASDAQAYVVPPQANQEQIAKLLRAHQIDVRRLENPYSPKSIASVGTPVERIPAGFPEGSLVIPIRQASRFLLQALMDPEPKMAQGFLEAEKERKEHRLPSEIYDVTAWSLPLCFNLTAYTVAGPLPTLSEWRQSDPSGAIRTVGKGDPYAYIIDYAQQQAPAVAGALLTDGFRVEVAEKGFTISGVIFSRGSYVVRTAPNGPDLRKQLESHLAHFGATAYATTTGYTDSSIDLGSDYVRALREPRIAVLMDWPVRSTSYGALRWLLESQYEIEFTPIKAGMIAYCDLRPYRTVVIPDASSDDMASVLGEAGIQKLKRWAESGGTLVGIGGGARVLLEEDIKLGGGRVITSFKKDSIEPAPRKKKEGEETEEEEGEYEAPGSIPGSFYRVALDNLDWLTAGYQDSVPVFLAGGLVIDWPALKGHCVARFAKPPKISGFSWEIDDKRLEGKAYLARIDLEDGQVIVFADEPYFRGYLRGLDRLLLNAVFNAATYAGGLDYP
ncbi:MAG: hypothetical protein HYX75_04615 [Acidobacteria bacterium]|nr:hypothetical protein [Acidobacteriota bacterium]